VQEGNPAHLLEAARQKGEVSSQSVLLVPHQQLCLLGAVLKLLGSVPSYEMLILPGTGQRRLNHIQDSVRDDSVDAVKKILLNFLQIVSLAAGLPLQWITKTCCKTNKNQTRANNQDNKTFL
jgi:hypothetical protein